MASTAGEQARRPWQLAASDWKQVLRRVKDEVGRDNVSLVAAGVAFYWLLAVFPAIVAAVSIWGLFADPAEAGTMLETVGETMPGQARSILRSQLDEVAGSANAALGVGTIVGIVVALWGANKGIKALMEGLNIAYDEQEQRSFVVLNLQAMALLLVGLLVSLLAAAGVVALPAVLDLVGLGDFTAALLRIGRWPLLGVGVLGFLAVAYRYGPCRDEARWSWTSAGAVVAVVLWLVGSSLFSLYVGAFGSYNETYGSIAGAVVLLLWFWLTAFVILLGGELNAELERQTLRDTTVGPPRPIGERGAWVADHPPDDAEPV